MVNKSDFNNFTSQIMVHTALVAILSLIINAPSTNALMNLLREYMYLS